METSTFDTIIVLAPPLKVGSFNTEGVGWMPRISLFEGLERWKTSVAVDTRDTVWDDLPKIVCGTTSWAPGTFKDTAWTDEKSGEKRQGMHRVLTNLESIELLVLDIDEGCALEEAVKIFAPYQTLICASKSHQKVKVKESGESLPPCDRFRIVIPLERPITNDRDFKATWAQAEKLCPAIDKSCKDSSRFFYPCTHVIDSWDGARFPVLDALPEQPPSQKTVPPEGIRGKLSQATKDFLAEEPSPDTWHMRFYKAAMNMKEAGFTQEEAAAKLRKASPELELDATDVAQLRDVYENRDPKYGATIDGCGPVRATIQQCHAIHNMADPEDVALVNLETGAIHDIAWATVKKVLDKKAFAKYCYERVIYAAFTYNPHVPRQLTNAQGFVFNTYQPAPWKAGLFYKGEPLPVERELPEIYQSFLKHLTGNHQESVDYLLDWIATSLTGRNFTILTAIGEQGIGKGLLGEVLEMLHGTENFDRIRDQAFKSQFNSQLRNKTLIYVDEADLRTKESQDRIKDTVNEWIEIEQKGKDAISVRNFASFYLSSNAMDAVKIEPGDRRFSVIELTETKLKDTPLIDRVAELRDPANIQKLACYLVARKPSFDILTPFRSARTEELKEASLMDWETHILFDWAPRQAGKRLPINDAQEEAARVGGFRSKPGRRKFEALAKLFPNIIRVHRVGTQREIEVVCPPSNVKAMAPFLADRKLAGLASGADPEAKIQ